MIETNYKHEVASRLRELADSVESGDVKVQTFESKANVIRTELTVRAERGGKNSLHTIAEEVQVEGTITLAYTYFPSQT